MPPRRQHMLAALPRRGTGERTQEASVRAGRLLAQCSHTAPDRIAAQELQHAFLHRTNVDGLAPASLRLCASGMRVFSPHVLTRDGHPLSLLRAHTAHRLPAVRRVEEGRRLLPAAPPFHNHGSCTTVESGGLRRHAALALQGAAIAGQRLQGHGHRGQGAQDRYVPLPAAPLAVLRPSWHTPRHTTWLLPATGREPQHSPPAPAPRRRPRARGACRTATQRASMTTMGVARPPLRHASAPPRLAAGVPPRLLQRSLGPPQRATTLRSLPRTQQGHADASARLHTLRRGLPP